MTLKPVFRETMVSGWRCEKKGCVASISIWAGLDDNATGGCWITSHLAHFDDMVVDGPVSVAKCPASHALQRALGMRPA